MHNTRLLALIVASALLAACGAKKTPRPSPAAVAAKPAQAQPPKPRDKSTRVEHNHYSTAPASKSSGLPAHEVGYYLDVLQGRLRQQLDPGVIISRESGSILLDFSRRFGFAADTAQVDDADRKLLAPLAKILVEYRAALVSVRVSAGDVETTARKLAQLRASAVERVLVDAGIAPERVVASVAALARDGGPHVEIVLAPEMRGD